MPYETIEQIHDRRAEKLFQFMSFQQLFGVLGGLAMGYSSSAWMPTGLRIIWIIAVILFGYVLATDQGGMAPYERWGWQIRGLISRLMGKAEIAPSDLPGTATHQLHAAVSIQRKAVTVLRSGERRS